MLSPPLLKLPGMAWKADGRVDGDGCSSDDDGESFSAKGRSSAGVVWFRLSSAIFEDGGTGRIGFGLMGLLDVLIIWLLGPNERFSTGFSPASGTAIGASVTGNVDDGNPPRLWLRRGCGFGTGAVSWLTSSWSPSIDEPINCNIKKHKKIGYWFRKCWNINFRLDLLSGVVLSYFYVMNGTVSENKSIISFMRSINYRVGGYVKETRSPASPILVSPAEKVLLSVARHLSWSSCFHKVPRDPSPISFPYLLQPQQEEPVLLLRPWHPYIYTQKS